MCVSALLDNGRDINDAFKDDDWIFDTVKPNAGPAGESEDAAPVPATVQGDAPGEPSVVAPQQEDAHGVEKRTDPAEDIEFRTPTEILDKSRSEATQPNEAPPARIPELQPLPSQPLPSRMTRKPSDVPRNSSLTITFRRPAKLLDPVPVVIREDTWRSSVALSAITANLTGEPPAMLFAHRSTDGTVK